MNIYKKFLILIFFCFLFLFSSCGEIPDCSTQNTEFEIYGYDEDKEKCVIEKKIPNCEEKNTDYKIYEYDSNKNECFLSEEIEKDSPTNGIIEEGETFCNAPDDVPKNHSEFGCFGNMGDYLEYQCKNNECILDKTKDVITEVREVNVKRGSYFNFLFTITFPKPYIYTYNTDLDFDDTINFNIELFNLIASEDLKIEDLVIESIQIKDGRLNLISEIIINEEFKKIKDSISLDFRIDEKIEFESVDKIYFDVTVSYTKDKYDDGELYESEDIREVLKKNYINKYTFINPNYFEEEENE